MCRLFEKNRLQNSRTKVIYMAPIKALCQERFQDWKDKFGKLNLNCVELTGDTLLDNSSLKVLMSADIILTTPEKFDSTTRKWKDYSVGAFVSQIALLLIDEIHLLNEERGACLEAVVSRMKMIQLSQEMHNKPVGKIRLVGVSATIPNFVDVAQWLNAEYLEFGDEYRPCKLDVTVLGFPSSKSAFQFEHSLDYKLASLIQEYNSNKPTLVFCSTRKSCSQSASLLSTESTKFSHKKPFVSSPEQQKKLNNASSKITDKTLKSCVVNGIGFHTAGLSYDDRKIVQDLFLSSDLMVICTTSTLAQGVNFPAHLVIIKGTQQYKNGTGYCEYSELSILQMIGRSGRPQFDEFGVALILTTSDMQQMYENIALRRQIVESHFHNKLICHLNAEIALDTISTIQDALNWLKSTFLYVRIQQNPSHYLNLVEDITESRLNQMLKELCLHHLKLLSDAKMIKINPDKSFASAPSGKLMARYYIEFETMQNFALLDKSSNLQDCLDVLCKSREFDDFSLRLGEKKILNEIKDLRFPYKGKTKTTDQKISCLIQHFLSGMTLDDFSLKQQGIRILAIAPRILKCMIEYLSENKFWACKYAIVLFKCIEQGIWENSLHVCKQLDKIGSGFSSTLVKNGITSFSKLEETNPRLIESILNRNPPFGTQLIQSVKSIPKLQLETIRNGNVLDISASLMNAGEAIYYLLVGNQSFELIHKIKLNTVNFNKTCSVSIDLTQGHSSVWIDLIHETMIGLDQHVMVDGIKSPVKLGINKSVSPPKSVAKTREVIAPVKLTKKVEIPIDVEDDFDLLCGNLLDQDLIKSSVKSKPPMVPQRVPPPSIASKKQTTNGPGLNANPPMVPSSPQPTIKRQDTNELISLLKNHFPEINASLLDELANL